MWFKLNHSLKLLNILNHGNFPEKCNFPGITIGESTMTYAQTVVKVAFSSQCRWDVTCKLRKRLKKKNILKTVSVVWRPSSCPIVIVWSQLFGDLIVLSQLSEDLVVLSPLSEDALSWLGCPKAWLSCLSCPKARLSKGLVVLSQLSKGLVVLSRLSKGLVVLSRLSEDLVVLSRLSNGCPVVSVVRRPACPISVIRKVVETSTLPCQWSTHWWLENCIQMRLRISRCSTHFHFPYLCE